MDDATEPVVRVTGRVVPVSADGEVLLLLDVDPAHPDRPRWGTIGGAVDPGETLVDAVVRELHEETGIVAAAADLVGPVHRGSHAFSYDGVAMIGDSTFFALPLARDTAISFDHLEPAEVDTVLEARWWTPQDLAADGRLVVPDLYDILVTAVRAVLDPTGGEQ